MKTFGYPTKYCRWIPFLTACLAFGCASGPQPQGIWPWEYGKETGNHQTGNYISFSSAVANFGDAPKAMKPISPESLKPHDSDPRSPAEQKDLKTLPPESFKDVKPGLDKPVNKTTRDYDFTVSDIKVAPPSYLPADSVRAAHDVTAFNHGNAPVTVTIVINPDATQNLSTNKPLPLNAVVPPKTDQAVVQFAPKNKNEAYKFRYTYSWSIGDYSARHQCPEHYQFPFGDNIKAYASAGSDANSTPYSRYAVAFSLPAGTPVLAARKGTVIQIKAGDRVDILHDDSTIATYSHLEKIAEGIIPGKVITTKDVLGIAGSLQKEKEAYMQLAVWRPEPVPTVKLLNTNSSSSGIDFVSFPLEFCTADINDCKVLTNDQTVSRKRSDSRKQAKGRSKGVKPTLLTK